MAPQWVLDAQLSHLGVQHRADASTQLIARLSYHFSKRTIAYASVGHIVNQGAAAIAVSAGASVGTGMSQSSFMTGIRHSF